MADDVGIRLTLDGSQVVSTSNRVSSKLKKDFSGVNKNVNTLNSSIRTLGASIGGIFVVSRLVDYGKELVKITDEYKLLTSQIRLVTDSEQELIQTRETLLQLSNETRTGLKSTVQLYSRFARSTKELEVSESDLLKVTKAVNQAIQISGASAASADAAIFQLSQGLAGALRGEELNSVLEQTPRLAQAIAEGLGITIGELRKYGEEGKLNAEAVLDAIKSQSDVLQQEFKDVEKTVGQSVTVLGNNFSKLVSKIDEATGASGFLIETLEGWADLTERLADGNEGLDELNKKAIELVRIEGQRRALQRQIKSLQDNIIQGSIEQASQEAGILARQRKVNELKQKEAVLKKELTNLSKQNIENQKEESDNSKTLSERQIKQKQKEIDLIKRVNDLNESESTKTFQKIREAAKRESEKRLDDYIETNKKIISEQEQMLTDQQQIVNKINDEALLAGITREQNQTRMLSLQYKERKTALVQAYIDGYNKTGEFAAEFYKSLAVLDETYSKKREKLSKDRSEAEQRATIDAFSQLSSSLRDAFGENKAFASADIILKTAVGIQRSFADLPPPASYIQAAAVGASGVAQLAKVNSANFATGVEDLTGPGTATSDSIPANLSRGESVLTASATDRIQSTFGRGAINSLNNGGSVGGSVVINAYTLGSEPDAYNKLIKLLELGKNNDWTLTE